MLVSCDNLSQDIGKLKSFCDQSRFSPRNAGAQANQLRQTKTDEISELTLNRVKLKVILNSPNLILDCLNESDVLTAAVLFRRAKYLCSRFTENEKRSFDSLEHHTIFLEKIFELIYRKCLDITNYQYVLDDQQLFSTLFAICLIKEESFDRVILEFLANRKSQCIELFDNESAQMDKPTTNRPTNVPADGRHRKESSNSLHSFDKLLNFFKIIFSTLEIVYNLYKSAGEITVCSIVGQIDAISIDYKFLNKNEQKALGQLFKEFSIEQFIKSSANLADQIERSTSGWFEEIRSSSANRIQQYLQTTSIDRLYESFDRVMEYFDANETLILSSHRYEVICKRRIDYWGYFLSAPFDAAWNHFLTNTIVRLFTNLKNKIQFLNEEEEHVLNVSEYIWSTDLNDLNEMHKKYCGATERVIELTNQTNEELAYLLEKFLLVHKQRSRLIAETDQKFKSYFFGVFEEKNREFLAFVDGLLKSNLKREQNFNLAHLLRMLVLICPNYKQCFDVLNPKCWFDTKELLLGLAYGGYNSYISQIIDDLVQLFYEELDRSQPLNCLHTAANWLEIEIRESIDDGKEVSTKIYLPKQISLPLDSLLTSLAIRLGRLTGHTLPGKLKLIILDELTRSLCAGYQKLYDSMQSKSIQPALKSTQILQIYFDLAFLRGLLYQSTNDETLKNNLQTVLSRFQQQIDPFDLHLFSSYLQTHIEHNKSSLAMVLNYLLPLQQVGSVMPVVSADHAGNTSPISLAKEDQRIFKLKFHFL